MALLTYALGSEVSFVHHPLLSLSLSLSLFSVWIFLWKLGGLICGSLVNPLAGGVGFAGRFAPAAITFCIPSSSACCLVCDLNPTLLLHLTPSASFIHLFMYAFLLFFLLFLFLFLLFTCEICTLSYLMPLSCCNIWQWEQTDWHCKCGKSENNLYEFVGFFLVPSSGSALFLNSYHSHAATSGNGERQIGIANEERPENNP
jgi:hypothetical protein